MAKYQRDLDLRLGDTDTYNPVTLSRMDTEDLRQEYRRLRKIANDRIRRIEKSEDFADAQIAKNWKPEFKEPAGEISAADLPLKLAQLEGFLQQKTSTLGGLREQRAKTLSSLKDAGVKGITKKNYKAFTEFMRQTQVLREAYIPYPKRSLGSEAKDAARQVRPKIFLAQQQGNISMASITREFAFFRDNADNILKLAKSGALNRDRKRPYSANEIRKKLAQSWKKGKA